MKGWFERNTPCGFPWRRSLNAAGWTAIFGFLWSLTFFVTYNNHYRTLFESWNHGVRVLRDGAVMTDFTDLVSGKMMLFRVIMVAMIFLAVYHYNYHYQGSKSIYLMKRLPKKSELWRRCLTVPAVFALTSEGIVVILKLIFFAYYMIRTPEACLVRGQWIW